MAGEEPRTLEEFKKFKVPAKAAHTSDEQKAAVKSACKAQSEYFGWKEGAGDVNTVLSVGRGVDVVAAPRLPVAAAAASVAAAVVV